MKGAELERAVEECYTSLVEIREAVQSNSSPRYGKEELNSEIQEEENICDRVNASAITAINIDSFELQLEKAKKLNIWEKWIPCDQVADLKSRLKDLKIFGSNLEVRKAEFFTAQRITEEEIGGGESQPPQPVAVPQPMVSPLNSLGTKEISSDGKSHEPRKVIKM